MPWLLACLDSCGASKLAPPVGDQLVDRDLGGHDDRLACGMKDACPEPPVSLSAERHMTARHHGGIRDAQSPDLHQRASRNAELAERVRAKLREGPKPFVLDVGQEK